MTLRADAQSLSHASVRCRVRRSGFSIVEILVAIGVITALLGVLLPALSTARRAGRSAQCRSNLRQMSTALAQYIAIYDAHPVALRFENNGVFTTVAWDYRQTVTGEISPGALWQFTDDPGHVMECPAYEGSPLPGGDPYTGYNYNTTYLGGEAAFPQVGWDAVRKGLRPAHVQRPSITATFGCGGRRGGTNKFMRAPTNEENLHLTTIYSGGQAYWHVGGSTNVAFADGHVATHADPQPGALATDALLEQFMDFPANGFLSQDARTYGGDR